MLAEHKFNVDIAVMADGCIVIWETNILDFKTHGILKACSRYRARISWSQKLPARFINWRVTAILR